MILQVEITDELICKVERYRDKHPWANKGYFDGTPEQQLRGMIGQIVVWRLLVGSSPTPNDLKEAFKKGFDVPFCDLQTEVKTKGTNIFVSDNFEHTFPKLQRPIEDFDVVVFCNYNRSKNILQICGWLPKETFLERSVLVLKGTKASNGLFCFSVDTYLIYNSALHDMKFLLEYDERRVHKSIG
jgi:hypothetical protein